MVEEEGEGEGDGTDCLPGLVCPAPRARCVPWARERTAFTGGSRKRATRGRTLRTISLSLTTTLCWWCRPCTSPSPNPSSSCPASNPRAAALPKGGLFYCSFLDSSPCNSPCTTTTTTSSTPSRPQKSITPTPSTTTLISCPLPS